MYDLNSINSSTLLIAVPAGGLQGVLMLRGVLLKWQHYCNGHVRNRFCLKAGWDGISSTP